MSLARMHILVLATTIVTAHAWAQETRPLREADVLKLIELQPEDEVIVKRICLGEIGFDVEDGVLARLKGAGASDAVLAALQRRRDEQSTPAAQTISFEECQTKEGQGVLELRGLEIPTSIKEFVSKITGLESLANKYDFDDNIRISDSQGKAAVPGGGSVNGRFPYELAVGKYTLNYFRVEDSKLPIEVRANQKTVVRFGGVFVRAPRVEDNAVYTLDKQLVSGVVHQNSPVGEYLLPGKYLVRLHDVYRQATIQPGKILELQTGAFTVSTGESDLWVFRHAGETEWRTARATGEKVYVFPGKYEWRLNSPVKGAGIIEIEAGDDQTVRAAK